MKKLILASLLAMSGLALAPNHVNAQEQYDDKKVYDFVSLDKTPSFPGGMNVFYRFLAQNIKYPEAALKDKIEGNVFLSFTITKSGAIEDVEVERKLGAGTDEEAVRVLKLSPNWNPGLIDGKAVNVKYRLPIKFSLKK